MAKLARRAALVTGAGSGIGAGVATLLAKEGCSVLLTDVNLLAVERGANEIGGSARFAKLDVTDAGDWAAAVDQAVSHFGRLDILVNNAGGSGSVNLVEDETPANHRMLLDINVTGVWNGVRAAVPQMRQQGGGSIVNVSSMNGMLGVGGMASYSATKYAVVGITRSAALELGHDGIRVNAVHPGFIETGMTAAIASPARKRLDDAIAQQPIARLGTPDDVALAVLFFASDDSSFCTGSSLLVDGGHIAGRSEHVSELRARKGLQVGTSFG